MTNSSILILTVPQAYYLTKSNKFNQTCKTPVKSVIFKSLCSMKLKKKKREVKSLNV